MQNRSKMQTPLPHSVAGRRPSLILWGAYLLAAMLLVAALGGCSSAPPPAPDGANEAQAQAPSTQRMVTRLRELERTAEPHGFLPAKVLEAHDRKPMPTEPEERIPHEAERAKQLLHAGRTEEALEVLRRLRQEIGVSPGLVEPAMADAIRSLTAIAAFRMGEEQNCVLRHTIDSCLIPIRDSGIHQLQDGAREALTLYREALEHDGGDLRSRWLLNIAAMTVGEYPLNVPEAWRIPESAFASDLDIGRFYDRAPQLGLDVAGLLGGVAVEDFNGDDLLDLMVSSWGLGNPLRLFVSTGDGRFEDRTVAAGLEGLGGGLNLVHADYDNDGHPDVLVLRGGWLGNAGEHPNSLLRNRGDGTFEDVTEAAGLIKASPTQTAAWGDFDNDGWLDLFIGNETTRAAYPAELWRNGGDGTFEEVAESAGVAIRGFIKGAVWGDYDNDGRQDLYVSQLLGPNVLFHNDGPDDQGRWRFSNVAAQAGVVEPVYSFPTWFWDYDNDGWLDLFVAEYYIDIQTWGAPLSGIGVDTAALVAADYLGQAHGEEKHFPRLYRNNRDGTFHDATVEAGLDHVLYPMGSNFGDLDNDGFLDFYVGTGAPDLRSIMPNRMFRNELGRRFQDVTTSGGFGHLQKGHGVAFDDFDNDGDQDIYTVVGGAYPGDVSQNLLFENPGHGHHWITLLLEGTRSNRSAIGARLRLSLDSPDGPREIHTTVSTGGSFGSSSLRQEIGLGQAKVIRRLEVSWPASGEVQVFENVAVDRLLRIREGSQELEPVAVPRFSLANGAGGGHSSHRAFEHGGAEQR